MGAILSGLRGLIMSNEPQRILMVGLDAAGKTTILYKFKLGETVTTIPTIGFNVETVKNLMFNMWDVGGQERIRALWGHYYQGVNAVIFVVDSTDRDRFEEAADELNKMLNDDRLDNAVVLVYANKQDLPGAASMAEMVDRLGLTKLKGRTWYVQSCVGTTGEGLYEGLDWLSKAVLQQPKH